MVTQNPNIPTVFIILGATGDLMTRKIVPALYDLHRKNKLPKLFHIIGVARRELSDDEFKKNIFDILTKKSHTKEDSEKFLTHFSYRRGNFEDLKDYESLAAELGRIDGEWKACSNKLFYLAVPPQYYRTIFEHLATSGLTIPCSPEEGWTRVIVEKPFGKDLETAESLDELLGKLFREEQIYRVDHYLGKEMMQNILAFRFSNNLLESMWNRNGIDRIEVKILEKQGIGKRGEFFDGVGALRDTGQNHILQMLSLVTMEKPQGFDTESVREARYNALSNLEKPTHEKIKHNTFRGQYNGYRDEEHVNKSSTTETYFRIKAFLESPRWKGVPIILEGGKAVSEDRKEISVWFKHAKPCLCPDKKHLTNKIVFSIEPQEQISIRFWSKKPGLTMDFEDSSFAFSYKKESDEYAEAYEKLLTDCIEGNQLLFISTKEIMEMWRFIDPIIKAWEQDLVPLKFYEKADESIRSEEAFISSEFQMKKEVGIIGLGKMGKGVALNLAEKGFHVVGYNRTNDVLKELSNQGITPSSSLKDFTKRLSSPRIIMLFLPAGSTIDEILDQLKPHLSKGDTIIDAGNSFYKDTIVRSKKLESIGLKFVDAGISGGPAGARNGACLMVGGERVTFEYLYPLFEAMALPDGVEFFDGVGAGHFVKMVHNGIEYGMMQSIAEGFTILKNSKFHLSLKDIARIYNNGSVIESRLINWLKGGLEIYGQDLQDVSGSVAHTGEGEWTVKIAEELGLKAKVIEGALEFRKQSEKNPSYTGKILSVLRNQFGGHKA